VVVVGEVVRPWLRSSARVGDVLLVSGTVGEAAAALHLLDCGRVADAGELPPVLRDRFVGPTPQLLLAHALSDLEQPPAAIDISDGLVQDAGHIADCSGVAITIEAGSVPVAPACRDAANVLGADSLEWALTSGEEYELLLAVPQEEVQRMTVHARDAGVVLTRIGSASAGQGVTVLDSDGQPMALSQDGWDHFAGS
jgi:thiamine-monophosphate kinase